MTLQYPVMICSKFCSEQYKKDVDCERLQQIKAMSLTSKQQNSEFKSAKKD